MPHPVLQPFSPNISRAALVALAATLLAAVGCTEDTAGDQEEDFLDYRDTADASSTPDTSMPDTEPDDRAPDTGPGPDYAELETPEQITLDWPGIGNTSEATFQVTNAGPAPMTIGGLTLEEDLNDELTELRPASEWPSGETIAGYSSRTFTVEYAPQNEGIDSGTIVVNASGSGLRDTSREIDIETEGPEGNQCPTASALARVVGDENEDWKRDTITTGPRQTVEFAARPSRDPDGSIDRYEWSIVGRPPNSHARLTPNNEVERPELSMDVIGEYTVELVVYDDDGAASCGERATVDIESFPNADVTVELTWNTPDDSDETDTDGTDLDLHYLNATEASRWSEAPWDIYWQNKNANWGSKDASSDDPRLVIDDTDGAGPEVVAQNNLVQNKTYRMGVYYFDSGGFGASYATVRVYKKGTLVAEYTDKELEETYDFWEVAEFTGDPNSVEELDQEYDDFPSVD